MKTKVKNIFFSLLGLLYLLYHLIAHYSTIKHLILGD